MERASTIHLYTSTPPLTCDESREKSSCGQDGNRRNRGQGELAATVTRRSVNKQRWIMSAGRETSSSHHRGKALKPGTRGLFQAIKRMPKTTNHPIGNRIPRRRLHVNLLTQLSIEECVLNIKLRHRPVSNRSDSKKSAHSGHMSHKGKCLIIVTAVLLLKAMSHKTRFIALKRSIRAGLNFIDPLTRDRMNTGRRRNKIPGASALKRSNLLSHGKLPFRMTLSIPIRSWLGGNKKTVLTRRVMVWSTTLTNRTSREKLISGRRLIGRRGRRNSRGRIQNRRTRRTRGTRRSRGRRYRRRDISKSGS
jgi:hypothetical protein